MAGWEVGEVMAPSCTPPQAPRPRVSRARGRSLGRDGMILTLGTLGKKNLRDRLHCRASGGRMALILPGEVRSLLGTRALDARPLAVGREDRHGGQPAHSPSPSRRVIDLGKVLPNVKPENHCWPQLSSTGDRPISILITPHTTGLSLSPSLSPWLDNGFDR